MCGITGYLNLKKGQLPQQDILRRMNACLIHRGPDDEGYYFGNHVALAHRLLSIIDLVSGRQPIFNEDGSIAIVFDGEIYNFAEIRKELETTGRHRFATNSDTETIVHLYEEEGEQCLQKLNGMFAFALWDERRERLFCARDRMGQKPFYYSVQGDIFIFGSELKALLAYPDAPRNLSVSSLSQYLAFEYIPAPATIFEGIFKLEPGHYFIIDLNAPIENRRVIKPQPYWDIRFDKTDCTFEEAKRSFLETYREAVQRRLISDVPLGVFLSGGIDSSSVVAMMSQMMPCEKIKTFCISFQEKTFNESHYARLVAKHFGTDHREELLPPERLLQILPKICSILDEPMADPSIIPTYLLSEFTKKHVTVALGGDGGDELFAGYDPFLAHRPAQILGVLPSPLITLLQKTANLLPVSTKNISCDFIIKQFFAGLNYDYGKRHFAWLGSFMPRQQNQLLSSQMLDSFDTEKAYDIIDNNLRRLEKYDDLDGIIYLYCKLYLQDDILVKVDRASMACSLEARAPFMDFNVVNLLCGFPNRWKLRGFTAKYLFKKAMEGILPREIINRRKKGFGIPIAEWLKGPLKESLCALLEPARIQKQGLFNADYISQIMNQHFAGKKDNRKLLWTLFIFQNWWNLFMSDFKR
ncbi:MAG TPA: asparagine synthase (glutamine-hydrolyzing) [Candidatus Sumerlaeota bacterium]|nr:MAG: Asparagine synthetase (glutamine-hydrolyzing) 1 [candidate division BRC1 bacterium ADurb.Bin183]HOE63503.1 asparagine synthase (glutamine-hydrolyzing) [Candidatus Sumerlaeota bacterium]HRR31446.1 asparagine synthase (glutamine-hydrolyzing) [Candidatus Sumerlaeia bacterium]HON51382.1 asparagine synthase (glutamine-hydrolyzing) [Candidatus Sumerlaeota bacterium]HOR64565.1 asparagine synthase (glutamine-hydrolyzing) [Candidatus Sumerlaeota bacterium]